MMTDRRVRCTGMPPVRAATSPALIIADGRLPSFVAAAIEAERGLRGPGGGAKAVLWLGAGAEAATHITRQARLLDIEAELSQPAGRGGPLDPLSLLTQAIRVAAGRGLRRVVWAATGAGPDGEPDIATVAAIIDTTVSFNRAAAAAAIVGGDREAVPEVETPLADLADDQIMDLFEDFALPMDACSWPAAGVPGAEADRRRWQIAASRRAAMVMGE